jgi:hypothetical protein
MDAHADEAEVRALPGPRLRRLAAIGRIPDRDHAESVARLQVVEAIVEVDPASLVVTLRAAEDRRDLQRGISP